MIPAVEPNVPVMDKPIKKIESVMRHIDSVILYIMGKLNIKPIVRVINLDKSVQRLALWERRKDQFRWTRIKAINGRKIDRSTVKIDSYRSMKRGEIGCWLSHRKAMATVNTVRIICEDDADLTPAFWDQYFEVMKTAPKDWEVLAFGASPLWRKKYQSKVGKTVHVNDDWDEVTGDLYGAQCYLIHHNAAQKFLSMDTMNAPLDVDLSRKLKTYLVKKDIVTQLNLGSTTQNPNSK